MPSPTFAWPRWRSSWGLRRASGAVTFTGEGMLRCTRVSLAPASATNLTSPRRPPRPFTSTAPPLCLLTWEVDAPQTSHRHCQRRLPFAERIPWIVETISRCRPDVVALQNSSRALSDALCAGEVPEDTSATTGESAPRTLTLVHEDTLLRLTTDAAVTTTSGSPQPAPADADEDVQGGALSNDGEAGGLKAVARGERPRYTLVGAATNGRCGEVQLFVRVGCGLEARLLPTGPGVSALFHWTTTAAQNAAETTNRVQGSDAPRHATHARTLPQFVLSTVDLSYRGKSITVDGSALSTAEVSLDGSPFTLTTPSAEGTADGASSLATAAQRPRGQLDPHREAALGFLMTVVKPDVVCGHVFMGQDESFPHCEDAWRRAGAPPAQALTTNTRRAHGKADTNYYYFVPSSLPVPDRGSPRNRGGDGEANAAAPADVAPLTVGTPLPLSATLDAAHKTWQLPLLQEVDAEDAKASSALSMPEVTGRFQRCLLRRGVATRTHTRHYSFIQRYRRCRVVVVKPFLDVPLTAPWEVAWHRAQLAHTRRRSLERQRRTLEWKRDRLAQMSVDHAVSGDTAVAEPGSRGDAVNTGDTHVDASGETGTQTAASTPESRDTVERRLSEVKQQLEDLAQTVRVPETVPVSLSDQFPLVVVLQ